MNLVDDPLDTGPMKVPETDEWSASALAVAHPGSR